MIRARVIDYDWYFGREEVDTTVTRAIEWYNEGHERPANFVQLCGKDLEELGLNGRLRGVTVFKREVCGERGNVMVGRIERV